MHFWVIKNMRKNLTSDNLKCNRRDNLWQSFQSHWTLNNERICGDDILRGVFLCKDTAGVRTCKISRSRICKTTSNTCVLTSMRRLMDPASVHLQHLLVFILHFCWCRFVLSVFQLSSLFMWDNRLSFLLKFSY